MALFMGIDLGTSSVKTILMNGDGDIQCVSQKGYDIQKEKVTYAEQNMEVLWQAAKETIQEVMASPKIRKEEIQGISFSGQMHGLVMVDKDGALLRPAIIWADQRSGEVIQDTYHNISKKELAEITYNTLAAGFLGASLLWVKKEEPEIYEKAAWVMLPKDYIRYQICGEIGTDASDASSSGIFDVAKRQWNKELLERLGLEPKLFPKVAESYHQAAAVTAACGEATGLPVGTPVFYGGGDSLMASVGNGMIRPNMLSANIGTASQLVCTLEKPLADGLYRTNTFCHVKEDLWNIQGSNLSGGVSLKWLMKNILHKQSYDEMTALAEKIPAGSEGLFFLPYLSGERTPYHDPLARGIFLGLSLKHEEGHMIRSVMEGIIYSLKNSLEIFQDMGITYGKIIASGGGARSQLFLQMQADIFDDAVYTTEGEEQACVGAAITAAVGAGYYSSYEEACERMVTYKDGITEPCRENQKIYEKGYQIYKELYIHNKEIFPLLHHMNQ